MQVEGLVLVDIDKGTVTINADFDSDSSDIVILSSQLNYKALLLQVEGLVLVDIDKGTVTINADLDSDSSDIVIPELSAEL